MKHLGYLASALLGALPAAQAVPEIVPGATWTATNTGRHIQAHGAGFIQVGSTYYMIGEDKSESGSAFESVSCYSSTDFVRWSYEGPILSRNDDSGSDLGPSRIVERPKVIYNQSTKKYVMWMHIDSSNYGEAKTGVATSDTVCGTYEYLGSFRPLGYESRDMGLFVDDDGSGYLMTEDRPNGLRIDALTDDYLNVTETVHLWDRSIEAPAMLKRNGYYFQFGSQLSGWSPNDNLYSYATSLSGPWSDWQAFAPSGSGTFTSQTNYVLPLGDNTAIYMGDRWKSDNLMSSTYVWLPLTFSGQTARLEWHDHWILDIASKTWRAGPSETTYEAESATLSNGATVQTCSSCTGGSRVGYLGGSSQGALAFAGLSSGASSTGTVVIRHYNGDSTQRWADVTCNGVTQTIAFLPTGTGNTPGNSTLNCALTSGSGNSIRITNDDGSWVADIDSIKVPSS